MRISPLIRLSIPSVTAIACLAVWLSVDPVRSFGNTGPGTQGVGIPQPFSIQDFESVRGARSPFPSNLSPGILHALGGCVDPHGNPPNSPAEYDLALRTVEDTSDEWGPGDTKTLNLILRSSSIRWVKSPPRIDLILIGGNGDDILIGGQTAYDKASAVLHFNPSTQERKTIADGTSNTILFTVPDVPAGLYRFHVFERSTGLCKASDFFFRIGGAGPEGTPTPTPTESGEPSPTPTQTPGGPTPTLRIPDYDDSLFVDGIDLPDFLELLKMGSEEADLDGEDGELSLDFFMFSLWWQSDQLRGD